MKTRRILTSITSYLIFLHLSYYIVSQTLCIYRIFVGPPAPAATCSCQSTSSWSAASDTHTFECSCVDGRTRGTQAQSDDSKARYGIPLSFSIPVFFWKSLYSGTDTVTVTNPKEQCPRTWLHATFFGDSILLGWLL